jgi:hypothetical protein
VDWNRWQVWMKMQEGIQLEMILIFRCFDHLFMGFLRVEICNVWITLHLQGMPQSDGQNVTKSLSHNTASTRCPREQHSLLEWKP